MLPQCGTNGVSANWFKFLKWRPIYNDSSLKTMHMFNFCVLLQATRAFCFENIALGKPTWQEHPWPDDRYYRGLIINQIQQYIHQEWQDFIFEVYGCIDSGVYGKNCTLMCPVNCKEGKCDINTGHCLKCIPGYQGQNCYKTHTIKDDKTTGSAFILIIGGIVASFIILITTVTVTIVYKRTKSTKGNNEETKRREESLTITRPPKAFPKSRLQSSVTCLKIDIEDGLAQPGFSKSFSKDGEETQKVSQSKKLNDDDVDIDEKIHEENPYGDFYVNEKPIPDIAVANLGNVIEENSKNEDDEFKKNYSTLLYGERYPCGIGKLPENNTKNRYKTTFPYDHSRVKLVNKESDYINANYIDGIYQENRYIATQGPTQNTVGDFWLMVWQEHVEQIVMLTNLIEGSKKKCYQYWPDLEETMACGMLTLHIDRERHYACYSIRVLRLTNIKQGNESRTITQYHYTAWPDHGTPNPLCLLMFHNHVTRTKVSQLKVPTLVHCSAGIGRTGTYIAIDALYEEGKQKSKINIAEYVRKMRKNRMNMVQTYEQYKTIFLTLHEMFKAPVGVQTANEYLLKSQSAKNNLPAYVSSLQKEFQRLLSIRHQYSENDFKMALQYKSVSTSILPLDKYVVFLTSSVPKRGNYINAISLPSFKSQNAFIATHYPSTGDPVDFIRLITDYESKVVVCMDLLWNVEFANEWLPTATEPKTVSPYEIKQQQELSTGFKCRKLEISKEKSSDEVWVVEIIEPNSVLSQDNPETTSQILGLVSFVQNVKTDNPVTVVSSDGAALCGVFCAVYNLIQQLTMDEEIDVISVVRLLQTRRPELCSTLEEYIMLHDALMRFLDKNK
uniref:protein-tyrosine-phosphatase n=1 Tax=Magallana gigas TaxID=29159 RepID=A0A8W8P2R4_MAGGI